VNGYFMEFDTERAGGFEPLRFVPKGKTVVLGIVTSKSGGLESAEYLQRRIAEGIFVKVIAIGQDNDLDELSARRWLPGPSEGALSSYTLIYGNKVAIISISDNLTPYGVVVEDAGSAAMHRLLFEQLWASLG